eukprot:scaffold20528_cov54-Phaeocystis_antarctica.AAC.2
MRQVELAEASPPQRDGRAAVRRAAARVDVRDAQLVGIVEDEVGRRGPAALRRVAVDAHVDAPERRVAE